MCSLMCWKEALFLHKFFNLSVPILQKPPKADLSADKSMIRNLFVIVCFSVPAFLSQPLSLLARFHPGRQVLGLWLLFCIVGSDGTGDALYCEPDIAVPWLQSGGQMDTAYAACPGIKRKTNQQTKRLAKNVIIAPDT